MPRGGGGWRHSLEDRLFLKSPWQPFSMQTTNSFMWSYLLPRPTLWTWAWQSPLPRPAGPLLAPKQAFPRSLNLEPRTQAEGPVCDWVQLWVPSQALGSPGCKAGKEIPALLYLLRLVGGEALAIKHLPKMHQIRRLWECEFLK